MPFFTGILKDKADFKCFKSIYAGFQAKLLKTRKYFDQNYIIFQKTEQTFGKLRKKPLSPLNFEMTFKDSTKFSPFF